MVCQIPRQPSAQLKHPTHSGLPSQHRPAKVAHLPKELHLFAENTSMFLILVTAGLVAFTTLDNQSDGVSRYHSRAWIVFKANAPFSTAKLPVSWTVNCTRVLVQTSSQKALEMPSP